MMDPKTSAERIAALRQYVTFSKASLDGVQEKAAVNAMTELDDLAEWIDELESVVRFMAAHCDVTFEGFSLIESNSRHPDPLIATIRHLGLARR